MFAYKYTVLVKANNEYATKQQQGVSTEKLMMSLAWDIKDLSDLNECGRKVIRDCDIVKQRLDDCSYDRISKNFAKTISMLCNLARTFVKRVTKYRRVAAIHVLVLMISPEQRTSKPYALPVQCIAYKSLKDSEVRKIANTLVKEMSLRGMKVAGIFLCISICYISWCMVLSQALQLMESGIACVKMETQGPYPLLRFVKEYEIDTVKSKKVLY